MWLIKPPHLMKNSQTLQSGGLHATFSKGHNMGCTFVYVHGAFSSTRMGQVSVSDAESAVTGRLGLDLG